MATVSEALDEIVNYSDNVGTSQTDQVRRRTRHLIDLRKVVNSIRYFRDWPWVRGYDTVTIRATHDGLLPVDFLAIGKYGGVFDLSNNGRPLEWVPESIITASRVQPTGPGCLAFYSIFSLDSSTKRALLQFPPGFVGLSMGVAYNTQTPTLDESTNNANLAKAIPAEYHDTVVMPLLRAKARESIGDARYENDLNDGKAGLKEMLRTCRRSQGTIGQLPSFFGR